MKYKCKKCGVEKDEKDFYYSANHKNNILPVCKACHKIRNNELYLAQKARLSSNSEDNIKDVKQWNKDHPFKLNREAFYSACGKRDSVLAI